MAGMTGIEVTAGPSKIRGAEPKAVADNPGTWNFALYINVAWLGAGMIWLSVFLINVTASHRRLEEKQRLHSRVRCSGHH